MFVIANPDVEAGLMVMEKFWDWDKPVLSLTEIVNPNVPAPVGVPEIIP